MAAESLFAASPMDGRLPFALPRVTAPTSDLSPGAWRLRPAPRRKAGMWQVRDGRNDVVADVYDKADAQLIVSSKALLLASVKLLNILSQLALEGRLTREDAAQVRYAIEVVQRAHLTASEVAPPACPSVAPDAKDIDLDPAFRTWCAQQYHAATAQGLHPASRPELRERYLRGER